LKCLKFVIIEIEIESSSKVDQIDSKNIKSPKQPEEEANSKEPSKAGDGHSPMKRQYSFKKEWLKKDSFKSLK